MYILTFLSQLPPPYDGVAAASDQPALFDSEPLGDPLDPIASDEGQRSSMSESDGINMMVRALNLD